MNFSNVKEWTITEGSVLKVTDSLGIVIWEKEQPVLKDYFYVEDISGRDNTLTIKKTSGAPAIEVFKSTNGIYWSSMGTTSSTGITATVPANGKLYLKATANTWEGGDYDRYNYIRCSGNHNVGGNITSLLYGSDFDTQTNITSDFLSLFYGNTKLVSAENLILPATTLNTRWYYGMFSGCTSLTTAPALPATTLGNYCYSSMFENCRSLTAAPALPATTLATECYKFMFYNCTSLTTAPVLPATTLVNSCYYGMFGDCTRLNKITTYATSISATNCLTGWLDSVSSTGTFHNMACTTYPSGSSGIPSGWNEVHTTGSTINVTITNTGNYSGATYQIDSGTAQPISETGTTSFTVPTSATTFTIHRNGKGVTDVGGICGYGEDTDWDAAFPVNKMNDNVYIDITSLM